MEAIMNIFQKQSLIGAIALTFSALSNQAFAECAEPTSPIIPDGNVASLDELKAAQGAFNEMQDNFLSYRECITKKIEQLDAESESFDQKKNQLTEKDDAAFAKLNKVADNLNAAIRTYKEK